MATNMIAGRGFVLAVPVAVMPTLYREPTASLTSRPAWRMWRLAVGSLARRLRMIARAWRAASGSF